AEDGLVGSGERDTCARTIRIGALRACVTAWQTRSVSPLRRVFVSLAVAATLASCPVIAQADTPKERAVRLFEQAEQDYRGGRFREAAALLRQAYDLDANPDLLYNLGRALEGLGELDRAIDAYDRYLKLATNVSD